MAMWTGRAIVRSATASAVAILLIASDGSAQTDRGGLIARAQVWSATNISQMDVKAGPPGPGSFDPGQTVNCDYLEKDFDGASKKFACRLAPGDEVKVKFGIGNGEVHAEVAATRLLWALGFGADRMYPVRVVCRGCPASVGDVIDPAVIERRMPGHDLPDDGWSWMELDLIEESAGGSTKAQVDALKLLATFLQHTDNKREQQRLLCLDEACARPFMMIADLGLTFGRANLANVNATASVNLREWSQVQVWKGPLGCIGNLPKSLTGTLKDPVISDVGRRLLASLLVQLSDRQLHDLFEVSGVENVDAWVGTFKDKRQEVVSRRCLDSWSTAAPATFGVEPIIWLQSRGTPTLTSLMYWISFAGYTAWYVAATVVLALVHRLRAGAALLILIALNGLVVNATKVGVSFPRPDAVDSRIERVGVAATSEDTVGTLRDFLEQGQSPERVDYGAYGFPSGHVAVATVFWLGLVFIVGWRWAWIGVVAWVPLMALSRMYLGRHFLGDVLGGFGTAVIVTAIGLLGLNLARLGNPATPPDRARRIARRVLLIAAALTASGIFLDVPDPLDASRLLGLAAGAMLILGSDRQFDAASPGVRVARLAVTAILFPLASWAIWVAVNRSGMEDGARALVTGALPAMVLLPLAVRAWPRPARAR
jgi:membrane-associated phospholipid phosphatase